MLICSFLLICLIFVFVWCLLKIKERRWTLMWIIQEQVKFWPCFNMLLEPQKGIMTKDYAKPTYLLLSIIISIICIFECSELREITCKQPKYPARLNQANFGKFGHCFCICEKPGQVPCPSRSALPGANKPKSWQLKNEENG